MKKISNIHLWMKEFFAFAQSKRVNYNSESKSSYQQFLLAFIDKVIETQDISMLDVFEGYTDFEKEKLFALMTNVDYKGKLQIISHVIGETHEFELVEDYRMYLENMRSGQGISITIISDFKAVPKDFYTLSIMKTSLPTIVDEILFEERVYASNKLIRNPFIKSDYYKYQSAWLENIIGLLEGKQVWRGKSTVFTIDGNIAKTSTDAGTFNVTVKQDRKNLNLVVEHVSRLGRKSYKQVITDNEIGDTIAFRKFATEFVFAITDKFNKSDSFEQNQTPKQTQTPTFDDIASFL